MKEPAIPYRALLAMLAVIFACRVAAQLLLQFFDLPFLPGGELWHSATMPYPTLLAVQLVIVAVMAAIVVRLPSRRPHPAAGAVLAGLGWVYLLLMTGRLIVGVLGLSAHSWFDGAVSTAFHFGLAAFLLVLGAALKGPERERARQNRLHRVARNGAYPALMVLGYALFVWLRDTGSPPLFAAYLSVLVAGFGIVLHEAFAPFRADWRPTRADVLRDGLFLALVQVALPAILKALTLALVVGLAGSAAGPFAAWWPHDAPVLAQVSIMLLIAEFFRYWIHRALHHDPLWPLHAVHHASQKLYTVNVGRFHPFDKSLQFLGDALPFLLLGVSPDVFAAYFVLYAINGFYQHSNADVRLGPLNRVIAGPELHRWHHSQSLAEARANYGNNLIVWDSVFGTRLLPRDRQVERIGIGNADWPDGFGAQLTAPFTTPTGARAK